MKKFLFLFVLLLLVGSTAMAQNRNNDDEVVKLNPFSQFNAVEGEVIVKFADHTTLQLSNTRGEMRTGLTAVDNVLQNYRVTVAERLCPLDEPTRNLRISKSYSGQNVVERDLSRLYLIKLQLPTETALRNGTDSIPNVHALIEALNALEEVEFAEPNFRVFALGMENSAFDSQRRTRENNSRNLNDSAYTHEPMYPLQWGIPAVRLPELWAADTMPDNQRPVIAIIDCGVDITHPDLAANIWTNPNETDNGFDDDGNGFVDDLHGWDFVNQTANMHDFNSHGTHCAGIAAAVGNNGVGITGANPNALIMPIAVLQSNGGGDIATIIRGINYAKNNGADVLSMSLGTNAYSIALEQALAQAYQNAVLVAAAGNDGTGIDPQCAPNGVPTYPGAFSFVLGVQATNSNNNLAGFSNYDCDGPNFSQYNEERLYNYEVSAPGVEILSTVPGGQYRNMNGTSMACPLVAGGISALLHAKQYPSQEMLWGDLINTTSEFHHVDFMACYQAGTAPAQLQFVNYDANDTTSGDGDNRPDAGEIIDFYPTIRTTWGPANNITIWLEFDEFEDQSLLQFINNSVDFGWNLSTYGMNKSRNPIRFRIDSNVVDGRNIQLVLCATASNAQDTMQYHFTISIENGVELRGMVTQNTTLYPNVHYIVTDNFGVAPNVTLTIKPGTTLKFENGAGISIGGTIIAAGKPDSMITFTKTDLAQSWKGFNSEYAQYDSLSYCVFEHIVSGTGWKFACSNSNTYQQVIRDQGNNIYITNTYRSTDSVLIHSEGNIYNFENHNYDYFNDYFYDTESTLLKRYNNLIFRNNHLDEVEKATEYRSVRYNNHYVRLTGTTIATEDELTNRNDVYVTAYNNHINNTNSFVLGDYSQRGFEPLPKENYVNGEYGRLNGNYFGNYQIGYSNVITSYFYVQTRSTSPSVFSIGDIYMGSSREDLVREHIFDFEYHNSGVFGMIDLSDMNQEPCHECHGIVWKVEVNGYDAQDEFGQLPPLGIGRHEFKVYFNRAMNTAVAPMVAMGVRPPYTQYIIDEDGSWSADSTIYTVYFDLTPAKVTDGLNRIYVANAEDDDFFEIPLENSRFNVQVSVAGSLSAGFVAMANIGKIDLEWNNNDIDFDDFLGYNMYRYRIDTTYNSYWGYNNDGYYVNITDTIVGPVDLRTINTTLIQDTMFTDYDVIPGTRYYYYYKVLRTSMTESEPSRTVSAIPLSAIIGDANGNFNVNVADIVTVVSFINNQNPQPFIFDAADVNGDNAINVLDIVGIINLILHPNSTPIRDTRASAIYSIEDGILYVETPVELGGVQFTFNMDNSNQIEILSALQGFEQVTNWLRESEYLFMAYSMTGRTIPAGKTALLRINEATIGNIVLSDNQGGNVVPIFANPNAIADYETTQMLSPYPNPFSNSITIPFNVGAEYAKDVDFQILDIMGRQIDICRLGEFPRGQYTHVWSPKNTLVSGIYFIVLRVDGIKLQTNKVIYAK